MLAHANVMLSIGSVQSYAKKNKRRIPGKEDNLSTSTAHPHPLSFTLSPISISPFLLPLFARRSFSPSLDQAQPHFEGTHYDVEIHGFLSCGMMVVKGNKSARPQFVLSLVFSSTTTTTTTTKHHQKAPKSTKLPTIIKADHGDSSTKYLPPLRPPKRSKKCQRPIVKGIMRDDAGQSVLRNGNSVTPLPVDPNIKSFFATPSLLSFSFSFSFIFLFSLFYLSLSPSSSSLCLCLCLCLPLSLSLSLSLSPPSSPSLSLAPTSPDPHDPHTTRLHLRTDDFIPPLDKEYLDNHTPPARNKQGKIDFASLLWFLLNQQERVGER